MRKIFFVVVTFLVMLITSRFVLRIVDATVQIDDDIGLLVTLLVAVNAIIGVLSYKLYKRAKRAGKK